MAFDSITQLREDSCGHDRFALAKPLDQALTLDLVGAAFILSL